MCQSSTFRWDGERTWGVSPRPTSRQRWRRRCPRPCRTSTRCGSGIERRRSGGTGSPHGPATTRTNNLEYDTGVVWDVEATVSGTTPTIVRSTLEGLTFTYGAATGVYVVGLPAAGATSGVVTIRATISGTALYGVAYLVSGNNLTIRIYSAAGVLTDPTSVFVQLSRPAY